MLTREEYHLSISMYASLCGEIAALSKTDKNEELLGALYEKASSIFESLMDTYDELLDKR
jgi:hypothetical protein